MAVAYVALGANLEDRLTTLRQAVDRLGDLGTVEAVSPVYETDAVGYLDQPAYLNAVARLRTELGPIPLLERLLAIETDLGRVRSFPNAPRTLDLDLLLYDCIVLDTPDLILPHPRMHERPFVLVPLADLAPNLVHPSLSRPIAGLLAALNPASGVRPFGSVATTPRSREMGS